VNPDLEIGRYLTEQAGFDRIPLCCGAIEYAGGGNEPQTTALLQAAVDNQGDGWQWTLEELGRYYEDCSALGEQDVVRAPITRQRDDRAVAAGMGLSLESAATLGRRTAELHQALASGPDNPAFSPEPFTDDDLANILAALRADVENSLDMLQENVSRLPDDAAGYAAQALERREALMNRFGRMETFTVAAAKIRIHGDYHLGQVLRTNNDYIIIDFEGEPARPLAERRAKHSPLKDVAGMLRSFSYAAYAGLIAHSNRRPGDFNRLLGYAYAWERQMSAAFLENYKQRAGGAIFHPADPAALDRLLQLFIMDKTFYELRYELNNRPAWARVPLQSIIGMSE
jgi:maltose alpha-D-glucosyltransferase/alpha-amylase